MNPDHDSRIRTVETTLALFAADIARVRVDLRDAEKRLAGSDASAAVVVDSLRDKIANLESGFAVARAELDDIKRERGEQRLFGFIPRWVFDDNTATLERAFAFGFILFIVVLAGILVVTYGPALLTLVD